MGCLEFDLMIYQFVRARRHDPQIIAAQTRKPSILSPCLEQHPHPRRAEAPREIDTPARAQLAHRRRPPPNLGSRHASREFGGRGAGANRVREDMKIGQRQTFYKSKVTLEI